MTKNILYGMLLLLGCGFAQQKNPQVQIIKNNISSYLDTAQLEVSLDSVEYISTSKDLILRFKNKSEKNVFMDDHETLVLFSEYIYFCFVNDYITPSVDKVTFVYKPDAINSSTISFPRKSFNEILRTFENTCYKKTIEYFFSKFYPELLREFQNRYTNVLLTVMIPPDKTFFQNLKEISELTCNDSKNIEHMQIFKMVLIADFYNYYGDGKMVYVVSEILLRNNIDLNAFDKNQYHNRMEEIVDSLALEKAFRNDEQLMKRREDLLIYSKDHPYTVK